MPTTDHLPARVRQQPATPVLDRTHPLAIGLVAYVIPGRGELVRPNSGVLKGAAAAISSPLGRAVSVTSATADGWSAPSPESLRAIAGKTTLTVVCWVQLTTSTANGHMMSIPYNGSWIAPYMMVDFGAFGGDTSQLSLRYARDTSFFNQSTSGTGAILSDSQMHCYAAVRDGTSVSWYRDGVLLSTSTGQGSEAHIAPTTLQPYNVGNRDTDDLGEGYPGVHGPSLMWNRALTTAELGKIYNSPHALLRQPGRLSLPILQALSAGSTSTTGSAALTLTATATATLKFPVTGSASVALTATGSATLKFPVTGSASVTLTATATTTLQFPTSGSAALTLTGSGTSGALTTGSALIDLTASASAALAYATTGTATLDLSASATSSTPPVVYRTFRPPTVHLQPADPQHERLWMFYGLDVGVSVLKQQDGTYRTSPFPTTDEVNAAKVAYIGGHEYQVDETEWASLIAAGLVDGEIPVPVDGGGAGYGMGAYGTGLYGG